MSGPSVRPSVCPVRCGLDDYAHVQAATHQLRPVDRQPVSSSYVQLIRCSSDACGRYRLIAAGAGGCAADSVMLRSEVRGSTESYVVSYLSYRIVGTFRERWLTDAWESALSKNKNMCKIWSDAERCSTGNARSPTMDN